MLDNSRLRKTISRVAVLLAAVAVLAQDSYSYSVLTHQAIIDSVWDDTIGRVLLKKYPAASPAQLREARAYAYGGAIIQDMGYYPFGSTFFSDLTHYVRSGDFIEALIAESRDINELTFALGALSHYPADNTGHSRGVNPSVPLVYPKLGARYGELVTYAQSPSAHIKTEFGFDVLQVARGHYAAEAYHDFIGFKTADDLLKRAFQRTYGLDPKELFASYDLAVATYRKAVSDIIPQLTRTAWEAKRDEIQKTTPGITQEKFIYTLSRRDYEREWGKTYQKPGVISRVLAFFIRVLPKIGPLKPLAFKVPTPEAEKLMMESFNETVIAYRGLLGRVMSGTLDLASRDLDTGKPTRAGEYKLSDEAHSELLRKLAKRNFENVTSELRETLLSFYRDLDALTTARKDRDQWRATMIALDRLKNTPLQSSNTTPRN